MLYQFSNLHVALVRDCLLANASEIETLGSACLLPPWRVAKDDLRLWFNPSSQPTVRPAQWQLIRGQSNGQLLISGVSQRVNIKRRVSISVPAAVLHPWQEDPPLPSLVEIDLSNHYTQRLLSPNRWHISQRNSRVLISDPRNRVVGLDAAHYKMLCALSNQSETPTERFLSAVQSSDLSHLPCSRHLLSCLCRILGADLLISA